MKPFLFYPRQKAQASATSSVSGQKGGSCSTTSVADPERFDADSDPTFQADTDPDPNPFTRVKKKFLQIFNYGFQSLPKLVTINFSVKMREEG